jgi:hypothetical protein
MSRSKKAHAVRTLDRSSPGLRANPGREASSRRSPASAEPSPKPRGRPVGSGSGNARVLVNTRVSPATHASLTAAAGRAGIPFATHVARVLERGGGAVAQPELPHHAPAAEPELEEGGIGPRRALREAQGRIRNLERELADTIEGATKRVDELERELAAARSAPVTIEAPAAAAAAPEVKGMVCVGHVYLPRRSPAASVNKGWIPTIAKNTGRPTKPFEVKRLGSRWVTPEGRDLTDAAESLGVARSAETAKAHAEGRIVEVVW